MDWDVGVAVVIFVVLAAAGAIGGVLLVTLSVATRNTFASVQTSATTRTKSASAPGPPTSWPAPAPPTP